MKIKEKQNIRIVLVVIGLILIYAVISGIYRINKATKGYEETEAICNMENKIIRDNYNEQYSYYQRQYSYIVDGKKYTLNNFENDSKPYKIIKYNPDNPNEARVYRAISTEDIIFFAIGVILICSALVLKKIDTNENEKLYEMKDKFLKMSKRNMMKIIKVCFWGYMVISLAVSIKDVFGEIYVGFDLNQIITQYSTAEIIIIECIIFIMSRCSCDA